MTQHDFTISDAFGLPVRLDLQGALQALATNSSGATPPATTYANMFWLDTSVLPDGLLRQRNQANTAWIAIAGVPAKASSADVIAGTDDIAYATPKGIADRDLVAARYARNRILNGAMQVSQENGDTAGTVINFYPADAWFGSFLGGVHSFQRVSSVTPRGSQKRIRLTVTTALAALAAGSYLGYFTRLEGRATADFGWGAAGARQVIARFGFRGPAGTYAFSVRNAASNRSYVKTFTITAPQANLDTEQTFVVPGDITGTWANDFTLGIQFTVCMAAGTTYQGADGVWQAGSFMGVAGMSNGMATAGPTFEVFDVGLYIDLNATGIAPLWEMPDEAAELLACQRQFCNHIITCYNAFMNSAFAAYTLAFTPAEMRGGAPTFTGVNLSALAFPVTPGAVTAISGRQFREVRTSNALNASAIYMTEYAGSARL